MSQDPEVLPEDRDLFYLRRDLSRLETKVDQIPTNQANNHAALMAEIRGLALTFVAKVEYDRDMVALRADMEKRITKEIFALFQDKVEEFMKFFKNLNYAIILAIVVGVLAILGLK